MFKKEIFAKIQVPAGEKVRISDFDPGWKQVAELWSTERKPDEEATEFKAKKVLAESRTQLAEAQELLWASDTYAILIILQAMDAAGKDSTIRHVMSGVNPQGCQVYNFKVPSEEELDHNFLWRHMKALPERGRIGIFNRSYYEDVLVVKVHPEYLRKLPPGKVNKDFWNARYEDINAFERHLTRNGTVILKFFLNISKGEQRKRFLKRLNRADKHWKFSLSDMKERAYWDDYMKVFEDALSATSTEWAPWYVIPADKKWAARSIVAQIITATIQSLDLEYPEVTPEQTAQFDEARRQLENEANGPG
jgi:PPK2 family polyphosphate:nucleotide phosphotransferase